MALNILLTENKSGQETPYPKLMIRKANLGCVGDIVLFYKITVGVLLKRGKSSSTPITDTLRPRHDWAEHGWEDYDGEITLSNLKE
jgi:hypothetical protein